MACRISIEISKLNKKMSECEMFACVRYVRGLISPELLQLNAQIRKHILKPTENSIAKYSDTINIGRQNDANLKNFVDKEIPRDEWSLPDLTLDIDCITEYLKKSLGATVAEVTMPKTMSGMSGGHIVRSDCAIFKVMKAKEALRNWIKNLVDKNELYARAAADVNVDEEAGAIDVEDDVLEDIVDEMDLVPVEEEMAIVPVIDTTLAEAQARAKEYIARTNAKPLPNETEDQYAARLANIMFSGNEARQTRSNRRKNNRDAATTMTQEEVGAAVEARSQYVLLKGTKNKRPHKILSQVTGKAVGKFYVCVYRDVGYSDQDIERTHPEDYLRQFPGFIESYEAVSGIPPTVYCHRAVIKFSLNFEFEFEFEFEFV
jgi:hypothetical protein